MHLHRPAPATIISLIALVFAMSGTAVAATGGNFILGTSNTAAKVTKLSNTKGPALSLSSTATTPPLQVSNSVQVPNLNASELGGTAASGFLGVSGTAANSSELGGQPASAFLGVSGTAANSSELGGTPASGFIQGGGSVSDARLSVSSSGLAHALMSAPGSSISLGCDSSSSPSDQMYLYYSDNSSAPSVVATWWNSGGGVGQATLSNSSGGTLLDGSTGTIVIVVRVDTGSSISTYTLTESYNSGASTCYFTGQVVTSDE